jgi:hypothetical protein
MTPPVLAGLAGGPLADEALASPAPLRWWAHLRAWIKRMDGTALRRLSAWPPVARLEAAFREVITMPNLLEEDPLHEISLYVDRHNHIHVHHPQASKPEDLILVANVLLKASQVVAAQAGAQVVSQPQSKKE